MALSITLAFIVIFSVFQVAAPRFRTDAVLRKQFLCAFVFALAGGIVVLGYLLSIDLVGSLQGSGDAATPKAILLCVAAIAFRHQYYLVVVWALLVLMSFGFDLLGAGNIWLYVFDPFALVYAIGILVWQRHRFSSLVIQHGAVQQGLVAVIVVFLLYAVYLATFSPDVFRHEFVIEDGFVEWTTVLVLLTAMSVCIHRAITLRTERSGLFLSFCLLLGLFCFFGAGEEVSWGQRILGLESPEFFQENNAQGEIGLHNLVVEIHGEPVKLNKLIFGTGLALAMIIYLFVVTPLYRRKPTVTEFFDAIAAPMPQNYQVAGYLAIVATVELLVDHSKRGEMTEFAGSIMFALNVIYPYNADLFKLSEANKLEEL